MAVVLVEKDGKTVNSVRSDSLHLFMRETDFSVVSDYRDTLILLPDTNLIKKKKKKKPLEEKL